MSSSLKLKPEIIVLDGIDGCGKTHQAKLLVERMDKSGIKAKYVKFPSNDTSYSSLIQKFLKGEFGQELDNRTIQIMYAFDRNEYLSKHLDELNQYDFIICDRYLTSNIIYSVPYESKNQFLEAISDLLRFECSRLDNPKPDQVFILDVPADIARKRMISRYSSDMSKLDYYEADLSKNEDRRYCAKQMASTLGYDLIKCVTPSGEELSILDINDIIVTRINKRYGIAIN